MAKPRVAQVHLSVEMQQHIDGLGRRWGLLHESGPYAGNVNVSATIARALRETVERES